ncbi:hypothetical protein LL662_004689 [Salmonella enterica]|nr:hypothetical protein [Salmonella enterica]
MSDSFCTPYNNPRTGNTTFGAAAQNGRIKTLGGMDKIIETITSDVTKTLLDLANNNQQSKTV